jgi:hypothetical protein
MEVDDERASSTGFGNRREEAHWTEVRMDDVRPDAAKVLTEGRGWACHTVQGRPGATEHLYRTHLPQPLQGAEQAAGGDRRRDLVYGERGSLALSELSECRLVDMQSGDLGSPACSDQSEHVIDHERLGAHWKAVAQDEDASLHTDESSTGT